MTDYSKDRDRNNALSNNRERRSGHNPTQELIPLPTDESLIKWIREGADQDMITFCENAGKYMANNGLTSSKIRNVYGEIKRIQMKEFEAEKVSFMLLKPKVAYAQGRDDKNQGLKLFKNLFDKIWGVVTNDNEYKNFCNLMEAILAYHKAFGGKD